MGCVASKKPEPLTPAESSGVSGNLEESGGILNPTTWNRIAVDQSESGESGKVSSNGTDSQSFKLGNFNKHVEGELAAIGWPSWLSAVAREAIQGWIPLKAEAYEKLEKVEQIHKIFKLCGSPSDEYWRKSRLPQETLFKPQQAYQSRLQETFRCLPENAYKLLEKFLSIEPQKRGTATSALSSEYFRTMPYACDPSNLPKYPPNKEIDAKDREESLKMKLCGAPQQSEVARRPSRSTRSLKSSVSSKLSRLEEPWLKAETTQKNTGRQNPARVNDETGLFVDMQQKEVTHSVNEDRKINLLSVVDNRFSAPLSFDAPKGFTWAMKQKEDQSSVRSHGDALGFCTYSKVEKPNEIEKNLMVHQWVQLGHPELDNESHNLTDMNSNTEALYFKPCNMGYKKPEDLVEFSAPLLYQSRKVDELLEKHEQQIRQAVRRAWLHKEKLF